MLFLDAEGQKKSRKEHYKTNWGIFNMDCLLNIIK